jgi:hypothetical protein
MIGNGDRISLILQPFNNPSFRIGLIYTLASFFFYVSWQSLIVHYFFSGDYAGVLMPGQPFGVPEREAAAGMKAVTVDPGWDGQFYYYLSNDPFLTRDAKSHLDMPVYRGQRIGVPILAHLSAKLAGKDVVPPRVYLLLQWFIVSIALGFLASWLSSHGITHWFACVWGLSFGMLHSGVHGLPDGAGDAWFILAFIACDAGRIRMYAFCATMLLLTREGYAAFGGMIFLFTLFGWIQWPTASRIGKTLLTALPGIIMFSWTAYLTFHLHESPLAARSRPEMTSPPYVAWYSLLMEQYDVSLHHEVKWKAVSAIFLSLIFFYVVKNARKCPILGATWAYIILTMMLGTMVWENFMGYPKALGTILIIGLFLLPIDRSNLLRFILIVMSCVSLDMLYLVRVQVPDFMSPARVEKTIETGVDSASPITSPLTDFRVAIQWENRFDRLKLPHSIWKTFHREQIPIRLTITNLSNQTWYPNPQGPVKGSIRSVATLRTQENEILVTHVTSIPGRVKPGESIRVIHKLILRPGKYRLSLTMVQEGMNLFSDRDPQSGIEADFEIQ